MNKRAYLVAAAIGLAVTAGHAQTASFEFTGTVTATTYIGRPGTPIRGSFTYDLQAQPYSPVVSSSFYSYQGPCAIAARVRGHTIVSDELHVTVSNDFGGNIEDSVNIAGTQIVLDGTTYPAGYFGMWLGSTAGHTDVLASTELPPSLDLASFNAQNYGYLQTDGGPNGTLLQFSIDSIEPLAPEKSAGAVCAGLARRN